MTDGWELSDERGFLAWYDATVREASRYAARLGSGDVDRAGHRPTPPWWIAHEGSVVVVHVTSIPVGRLLERLGTAPYATASGVQRTIGWLTGLDQ